MRFGIDRKHTFWYCIKPLFLYFITTMLVEVGLITYYLKTENINAQLMSQEQLIELCESFLSKYLLVISLVSIVLVGIYAVVNFVKDEKKEFDDSYESSIKALDVAQLMLFGIGYYFFVQIFMTVCYGYSDLTYQEAYNSVFSGGIVLVVFTSLVLQPAVFELLFRGLIFNRMKRIMSAKAAVLISSFVFAAIAASGLVQFLWVAVFGVILSYTYEKYKKIIAPMIASFAFYLCDYLFVIRPVYDFLNSKTGLYFTYVAGFVLCAASIEIFKKKQPAREKSLVLEEDHNDQNSDID